MGLMRYYAICTRTTARTHARARTHTHTHTHTHARARTYVTKSGEAELSFLFCAEVARQFSYISGCSMDCTTLFEHLG